MNEELLGTLVRDMTKVGSIHKSEARRRIEEINADSQQQLLNELEGEFEKKLDSLMEKLADIEHERWAKWQQYLHSKLQKNPYQGFPWLLDEEWVERWSKQIGTDYEYLSEKEKESDREQVRPYLSLIKDEVKALIQSKKSNP